MSLQPQAQPKGHPHGPVWRVILGLAAAALLFGPAAGNAQAQSLFPRLFQKLSPGMSRGRAVAILKYGGARIVSRQSDNALADALCHPADTACRRKLLFTARIVAQRQGRLYSLNLTSGLTGNRVYQVALVAARPAGMALAVHRARIAKALDQKPVGRGKIAMWRPKDVDWTLIVSWTNDRYTAVKRDTRLLREDRIARDRRRRGR